MLKNNLFFIKVFEMRGSGSESYRVSDARGGEGEKSFLPKKASPPLLLLQQQTKKQVQPYGCTCFSCGNAAYLANCYLDLRFLAASDFFFLLTLGFS
jgi:hypothetical protein